MTLDIQDAEIDLGGVDTPTLQNEPHLDLARTVTVLRAARYSGGKIARGCKIYKGMPGN